MRIQYETRAVLQQFGLALAAIPNTQKSLLAAVAHRQNVVGADEHIDLAEGELARMRRIGLQQVHHGEQGLTVLLDLRSLMSVTCVLHGEFVQVELGAHFVQLGRGGIGQRHPDKAARPRNVLADVGDGNVRQLGALFVGHAVDQHRDPLETVDRA